MTIKVGDDIYNGQVFVAEVNEANLITKISIPALGDGTGPLVVTISPTSLPGDIAVAIAPFLALLPH